MWVGHPASSLAAAGSILLLVACDDGQARTGLEQMVDTVEAARVCRAYSSIDGDNQKKAVIADFASRVGISDIRVIELCTMYLSGRADEAIGR